MNNIFPLIRYDREFGEALRCIGEELLAEKPLPIIANGLFGGMLDAFLHETIDTVKNRAGRISLIITSEEHTARRLSSVLSSVGERVMCYPERELVFHNISASHDTERERLFVLHSIISGECDAVVTTPSALMSFTMPREVLSSLSAHISVGDECDLKELSLRLTRMGYKNVEGVEGQGQYSIRGGIVDVFPKNTQNPVRMELFGDEIDRMGYFDVMDQRFIETCDELLLLPAKEMIADENARKRIAIAIKETLAKCKNDEAARELRAELSACENGLDLNFIDKYLSCVYPAGECLLDYFDKRIPVFVHETNNVKEKIKTYIQMTADSVSTMLERGSVIGKYAEYGIDDSDLSVFLSRNVPVHVNSLSTGLGSMKCSGVFGFRGRKSVSYDGKYKLLVDDLSNFIRGKYKTVILCSSDSEAKSVTAALADDDIGTSPAYLDKNFDFTSLIDGGIYVAVARISSGFELIAPRIAAISVSKDPEAAMRREIKQKRHKNKNAGERIMSFADLHEGDFVVHANHGIGQYVGMTSLRTDGVMRDYVTIRYAGTDKLFLPADRLEMISKYIGTRSEDGGVKLSRLGGAEWHKSTARAKAAAKDMAKDLIALYAERQRKPGYKFPAECEMEREFAEGFEYEETEPQLTAISEITSDMEKSVPMERLLCGDVGFGKTEVALRAAFKAICAGKQVAILVPTTILALQHYQTAMSRMRGYPVNIEMLSRFRTAKESAAIMRRLKRGEIDLVVGTHKLLGKDVEFKNLGLLIVDEEQRFGVAQKEKIKMRSADIDVLTLTATPIPRTLNMAMSGIRDMSILDEAPGDRLPVQTYVLEYDDLIIEDAIARELGRKGQVLYLYNKVEGIDIVAGSVMKKFPEARVAYAHGKMEHDELEDIWQALVAREIDILVCTTIIETGVDLPNANTLIIERADRMGLSQLHQIRGRIGRAGRQAYAYFTYKKESALSEIAQKRLMAIREYAEFGAGFKIALRDLEIRGAGNLLGTEQHGNIDAVGYDMYIRLLNEAILEEKGEKREPPFESTVDFRTDCYIPDYYIRSSAQRMEMYKKISLIQNEEDRRDVFDEICDRFSDPPEATVRLLHASMVRALSSKHKIAKVSEVGAELRFNAPKFDLSVWSELFMDYTGMRLVATGGAPFISYRLKRGEDPVIMAGKILVMYDKASEEDKKDGAE